MNLCRVGLAMLFDQAGGKMTHTMAEAVEKNQVTQPYVDHFIGEVKTEWDLWDSRDGEVDNHITFNNFYQV